VTQGRRNLLAVWALVLLFASEAVNAAVGRMRGTVVDEAGRPLEGVQVTVTCADIPSFRSVETTSSKGGFNITFSQPHHDYRYLFVLAGYQSFEQVIGGTSAKIMRANLILNRAEVSEKETALQIPAVGSDAGILAYNAGLVALKAGDLETARVKFEAAIAEADELVEAHAALAGVHLNQRNFEEAVVEAEKALALRPGEQAALEVQYEAYRALGRDEEARMAAESLRRAQDNATNARLVYNEGGEAYEAGDLDAALSKFREAAKLDPNLYDAHHAVASLLLKRGDVESAAAVAETALTLKPNDSRSLEVAYEAYNGLGQSERATEILVQLSALDPRYGAANLLERGAGFFNSGRSNEARILLESALAIDPALAKAHYMLGLYYVNQGENSVAKNHLNKFLELDADAATAREMLGFLE
jgi:tetratricopeptide (TPR) repeat protein